MRRFIADTRAAGANPVLLSLTPRNAWTADGKRIVRKDDSFTPWIKAICKEQKVPFIDLEDITANKDKLGFSAFTSAGMDGSSDWRFKTHLANLPIYYEYKDEGIDNTDAIKGTYLDNYRQIWDLYINNATCKPTELSTKTADEATADFVTGEAVIYQNGT